MACASRLVVGVVLSLVLVVPHQSVLGRQYRDRPCGRRPCTAGDARLLALDRRVRRRLRVCLAAFEARLAGLAQAVADAHSARRDRHRHLQHDDLCRAAIHRGAECAVAAIGDAGDRSDLGLRPVRRAPEPVADPWCAVVAPRRRRDRQPALARGAVAYFAQYRRHLDSRRGRGLCALYADLGPADHQWILLVTMMGIGSCMILPFYLAEAARGAAIQGGLPSYAAIAYTAVLPSFVAYLFFNRGVELIGPGRAGQSAHLMPVLGAILAVLFLGERFHLYHVVGIVLIAGGILLASRISPRKAAEKS